MITEEQAGDIIEWVSKLDISTIDHSVFEEIRYLLIQVMSTLDIDYIVEDMQPPRRDYSFLGDILEGNGWTQYRNLTDLQIVDEFINRDFEGDSLLQVGTVCGIDLASILDRLYVVLKSLN